AQPQRAVVTDCGDGPQVAVLHPARGVAGGAGHDVLGVVLPGDHHVPDRGFETVGEDDAGAGDGADPAVVGGGLLVELAHQIVGRGDHQGDLPGLDVGDVGGE